MQLGGGGADLHSPHQAPIESHGLDEQGFLLQTLLQQPPLAPALAHLFFLVAVCCWLLAHPGAASSFPPPLPAPGSVEESVCWQRAGAGGGGAGGGRTWAHPHTHAPPPRTPVAEPAQRSPNWLRGRGRSLGMRARAAAG